MPVLGIPEYAPAVAVGGILLPYIDIYSSSPLLILIANTMLYYIKSG
jgi:hypothetical protein